MPLTLLSLSFLIGQVEMRVEHTAEKCRAMELSRHVTPWRGVWYMEAPQGGTGLLLSAFFLLRVWELIWAGIVARCSLYPWLLVQDPASRCLGNSHGLLWPFGDLEMPLKMALQPISPSRTLPKANVQVQVLPLCCDSPVSIIHCKMNVCLGCHGN